MIAKKFVLCKDGVLSRHPAQMISDSATLRECIAEGSGWNVKFDRKPTKVPYSRDYKYPSIIRTPQIQVPI